MINITACYLRRSLCQGTEQGHRLFPPHRRLAMRDPLPRHPHRRHRVRLILRSRRSSNICTQPGEHAHQFCCTGKNHSVCAFVGQCVSSRILPELLDGTCSDWFAAVASLMPGSLLAVCQCIPATLQPIRHSLPRHLLRPACSLAAALRLSGPEFPSMSPSQLAAHTLRSSRAGLRRCS